MKLLLCAYNIHTGGGKVLLDQILLSELSKNITVISDQRYTLPKKSKATKISIAPTILNRIKAEVLIKNISHEFDKILFFGNLPPLFTLKTSTIVYLQNRYLIENFSFLKLPFKPLLRTFIEKLWFKLRGKYFYQYYVQTESMLKIFNKKYPKLTRVYIKPFFTVKKPQVNVIRREGSFIYVASGEPHKNHYNLIEAWKILKPKHSKLSLSLVLKESSNIQLYTWIDKENRKYNLNITLIDNMPRNNLLDFISKHQCLIFPSLFESFGLPLIEAENLGLDIIASNKDYSFDVSNPIQTFEPTSPSSIAEAILSYNENRLSRDQRQRKRVVIQTTDEFLRSL